MACKDSFLAFANYGGGSKGEVADCDNKNFLKLCKDSGFLDSKFTSTDVDLIFTTVKAKGGRRINFIEFQAALGKIAAKKKTTVAALEDIVAASSPVTNATKAEATKFHDDKSLYTGVHAKGGPTTVDRDASLAGLLDRSPADVRGVKF